MTANYLCYDPLGFEIFMGDQIEWFEDGVQHVGIAAGVIEDYDVEGDFFLEVQGAEIATIEFRIEDGIAQEVYKA